MSKRNIYSIVFLGAISLVALVIIVLFSYKKTDNYSKLKIVTDYTSYYSAVENTNNFIKAISTKSSNKVYSLLSKSYIDKKFITKSNVLKRIGELEEDTVFSGDKIYVVEDLKKNTYLYLINGKLIISRENGQKVIDDNYKIGMFVDFNTMAVSFYPLKKDEDIDYFIEDELKINNNSLKTVKPLLEKNMCKIYYNEFIKLIKDPNELYNYMTDEYKQNNSLENFKSIINSKYNNYKYNFKSCDIEQKEDESRIFNLIDNQNKTISIYEKGVMNYKFEI